MLRFKQIRQKLPVYFLPLLKTILKYAWAIPLKDKSGRNTTAALRTLIEKTKRKPDEIWSDRGKEFYYKTFLEFPKQNEIQI